MAFNSLQYIVFLCAVFALYWAVVKWARVALGVLLCASLVFYASWRREYLLLLLATAAVDYFAGALLSKTASPLGRKCLLALSLTYNLGMLALFKYFDFAVEQVAWLSRALHWGLDLSGLDLGLLLPVGISFFTFQSMSYTIDIYRRQLEPVASFPRYLLYVSFFPQLVAGPIVRARDFLPQLNERPPLTDEMGARALLMIGLGLFKKMALADYLALNLVDRAFAMPLGFSSLEVLLSVYGYAIQIYCDFSGYSDIAIGSALLLGYRFPKNFDAPYRARNLQDFWRRWHISLSSWLRDYLYIGLGGNRRGRLRTYANLIITMLLGGLWHGAGWNFVIWGGLHGVGQAIQRAIAHLRPQKPLFPGRLGAVIAILCTFHFVCLAWIFFRCPNLEAVGAVLGRIGDCTFDATHLTPGILLCLAAGFAFQLCPHAWFEAACRGFGRLHWSLQGAAIAFSGLLLRQLAAADVVAFIYFQF